MMHMAGISKDASSTKLTKREAKARDGPGARDAHERRTGAGGEGGGGDEKGTETRASLPFQKFVQ